MKNLKKAKGLSKFKNKLKRFLLKKLQLKIRNLIECPRNQKKLKQDHIRLVGNHVPIKLKTKLELKKMIKTKLF
jgi:hypothetical protein